MNSELNKVFGRDFIIGFFLPALFFGVGTYFLARVLWPDASSLHIDWHKPFEETGVFLLLIWVFAVFLQSVNREIFRTAEGYWGPSEFRDRASYFQRKRFRKLHARLKELRSRKRNENEKREFRRLSHNAAVDFPSTVDQVLPTSFGNAVRAYEDYPRVIYGIESIVGWSRLQALISKEFRELLSNDRARVDLWLNLCVVAVLFAVELAPIGWIKGYSVVGLILLPLIFAWFAYARARNSVRQYGEQVKGAFDVYLPALAGKLSYALSSDPGKNQAFWHAFSQLMIYRDPKAMERMSKVGLERLPPPVEKSGEGAKSEED